MKKRKIVKTAIAFLLIVFSALILYDFYIDWKYPIHHIVHQTDVVERNTHVIGSSCDYYDIVMKKSRDVKIGVRSRYINGWQEMDTYYYFFKTTHTTK